MQIVCQVQSDNPTEYKSKQNGVVKIQRLSLADRDPSGARLKNTFDYDMTEEEKAKWAGKLLDKTVVLSVTDIQFFMNRARMAGRIVEVKEK